MHHVSMVSKCAVNKHNSSPWLLPVPVRRDQAREQTALSRKWETRQRKHLAAVSPLLSGSKTVFTKLHSMLLMGYTTRRWGNNFCPQCQTAVQRFFFLRHKSTYKLYTKECMRVKIWRKDKGEEAFKSVYQVLLTSAMLFWIGVPVRSRRLRQLKPSKIFHRALKKRARQSKLLKLCDCFSTPYMHTKETSARMQELCVRISSGNKSGSNVKRTSFFVSSGTEIPKH